MLTDRDNLLWQALHETIKDELGHGSLVTIESRILEHPPYVSCRIYVATLDGLDQTAGRWTEIPVAIIPEVTDAADALIRVCEDLDR